MTYILSLSVTNIKIILPQPKPKNQSKVVIYVCAFQEWNAQTKGVRRDFSYFKK